MASTVASHDSASWWWGRRSQCCSRLRRLPSRPAVSPPDEVPLRWVADAISRVGDSTIESIVRHLDPAEQSVGVTSRLIEQGILDLSSPGLERYLFTQLAVMQQMTGAFVGFPDGGFAFVSRERDGYLAKRISASPDRVVSLTMLDRNFSVVSTEELPEDRFDPRERPWYMRAATTSDVVWTDPYVFFTSHQPGITAARAARRDGRVAAIVGVDVELSGLSTFLDNLPVARSGQAFVVSEKSVVATPASFANQVRTDLDGTLRLPTADEIGMTAAMLASGGEVVSIRRQGHAELVLRRALPSGQGLPWSVVIRARESDFTGPVRQVQRSLLISLLGGSALVIAAVLLMLRVHATARTLGSPGLGRSSHGPVEPRVAEQAGRGPDPVGHQLRRRGLGSDDRSRQLQTAERPTRTQCRRPGTWRRC